MSKPFASIDSAALETVTGGRRSGSTSQSSTDERLLTALDGIKSALADLSKSQQTQNHSSGLEQLLPLLLSQLGGGGGFGTGGGFGCGNGRGGGRR
jgi:hypothetical protein